MCKIFDMLYFLKWFIVSWLWLITLQSDRDTDSWKTLFAKAFVVLPHKCSIKPNLEWHYSRRLIHFNLESLPMKTIPFVLLHGCEIDIVHFPSFISNSWYWHNLLLIMKKINVLTNNYSKLHLKTIRRYRMVNTWGNFFLLRELSRKKSLQAKFASLNEIISAIDTIQSLVFW